MFNKNLIKEDIIKFLSNKSGFSNILSKKLINDLIEIIIMNIQKGNFNLKNLGSFKIIYKKERVGRNPKTMEEHIISSKKTISFRPSEKISKKLNKF